LLFRTGFANRDLNPDHLTRRNKEQLCAAANFVTLLRA